MDVFTGTRLACIRGERLVFDGLDFRVASGEALVLRGPNGSGKSSLLRLMAGLSPAADGSLAWNDTNVRDDPEGHRARLHYVGHLDAVKPVLTVFEQLTFWARICGLSTRDAGDRATSALDDFGIAYLCDIPGRYLSAGQRRRVSLARALTTKAAVWLLDEPRTALDTDAVERLDAAVARHRSGGGIIVLSQHGEGHPEGATALDLADFKPREDIGPTC